mgnify:CR=1 FL=1
MKAKLLNALGVILMTLCCLGFVALSFFWPRPATDPTTYKGQVVEKHLQPLETQYGSKMACYLLIETQPGQRVRVEVSPAAYQRAQIGMTIEKTAVFAEPIFFIQPNAPSHSPPQSGPPTVQRP